MSWEVGCATFMFYQEGREIYSTVVQAEVVEGAEGHCSLYAQFEDSAVSNRMCMSGQKCSRRVRHV